MLIRMISLRQLRYLEALATHLHFRKAAEAVAVSQPALSMQIRELEEELGLTLVERRSNGIQLTPEGEEIVRRGRRILADVRDLTDYAHHSAQPLNGPLRLGIIPSIAPYLLPSVLPALQKAHPDLSLVLRETLTATLIEELQAGDLDAVIAALPIDEPALETAPLFEDRFLLAVKNDPALDERRRVSIDDIRPEELLLLEEGHCLRDQALTFCHLMTTGAPIALGATSLGTVLQMVAAGYGVTLLPELCIDVEVRDARVALLRFEDPQPSRTVGLIWRTTSPRSNDFRALRTTLLEALGADNALPHARIAD